MSEETLILRPCIGIYRGVIIPYKNNRYVE